MKCVILVQDIKEAGLIELETKETLTLPNRLLALLICTKGDSTQLIYIKVLHQKAFCQLNFYNNNCDAMQIANYATESQIHARLQGELR